MSHIQKPSIYEDIVTDEPQLEQPALRRHRATLATPAEDEEEPQGPQESQEPQKKYETKIDIIELKYPIDVVNLRKNSTMISDQYGTYKQDTYDVSCFSSIKFQMETLNRKLGSQYPGYQFKTYWYRAVPKMKGTIVGQVKLTQKINHGTKIIHTNVELLSPKTPFAPVEGAILPTTSTAPHGGQPFLGAGRVLRQ